MRLVSNDRWSGSARLRHNARHRYTIEAWRDAIGTWREAITKKLEAGQPVATELAEGRLLLEAAQLRSRGADARLIAAALAREGRARTDRSRVAALADDRVVAAARRHPDRSAATRYRRELPLIVDRELARFSAWYELFPRSQGHDPDHPVPTSLAEAEWRLPQIAAMGFDVVYLPPIHPIGRTNRKGRDNAVRARRGDPGSPWAIGRDGGGHTAVAAGAGRHRGAGALPAEGRGQGLEVALDLALQASPDHPWVKEHPEWFRQRARRHDQVRGESAEALRGHLPVRFRGRHRRRPRGAVARVARGGPDLGRARYPHLSRRQSTHQADRVLALADRRGTGVSIPVSSSCPRRSPPPS